MIEFTTIDDTGEPVQSFQVTAEEHVAINVRPGQQYILGPTPENSYWKDGAWVKKPDQPSPTHVWNPVQKVWGADPNAQWLLVRTQRDRLLARTDWVVTKATERGEPVTANWHTYRQALRDITQQGNPWAINWPQAPN